MALAVCCLAPTIRRSSHIRLSLCSPEFAAACEAQFEVLAETMPLRRAAVFVHSEDLTSGNLEFFPVAVWPVSQPVFVVGENEPAAVASPSLTGGQGATSLLPEYPFLPATREDGVSAGALLADGGLSVPLAYKADTLGVLAIWRDGGAAPRSSVVSSRPAGDYSRGTAPDSSAWSAAERRQAERVARTLAVAAALDRASGGSTGATGVDERSTAVGGASPELRSRAGEGSSSSGSGSGSSSSSGAVTSATEVANESHELLLREIRALLQGSVHQLNSPLSAVRTLSKLLLRRLDGDDTVSREVTRGVQRRFNPWGRAALARSRVRALRVRALRACCMLHSIRSPLSVVAALQPSALLPALACSLRLLL